HPSEARPPGSGTGHGFGAPLTAATPLSSHLVLELDDRVASSYAGRVLRACGARVIRVEHPARPAETRRMGPFRDLSDEYDGGTMHHFLNGSKESITLD